MGRSLPLGASLAWLAFPPKLYPKSPGKLALSVGECQGRWGAAIAGVRLLRLGVWGDYPLRFCQVLMAWRAAGWAAVLGGISWAAAIAPSS